MKQNTRKALLALTLAGAFWHLDASAGTLPVTVQTHEYSYDLKPTNSSTRAESGADNNLGLKIGGKSKIELYGTVDIGYEYWSHKN